MPVIVPPEKGKVVLSKMGRDKDKLFCVVGILDEEFVLIADGKYRKLNKPKKKRWKHLRPLPVDFTAITEKLREGKKIFDSELASALKNVEVKQPR